MKFEIPANDFFKEPIPYRYNFFKWSSFEIFRPIFWILAMKFLGFYLNIFYKLWLIRIFLISFLLFSFKIL